MGKDKLNKINNDISSPNKGRLLMMRVFKGRRQLIKLGLVKTVEPSIFFKQQTQRSNQVVLLKYYLLAH